MTNPLIRIATRKSPLALWQADFVRKSLLAVNPELAIQLVEMTTTGDRFLNKKILEIGGKGMFVKELEEALINGVADLAVHSAKDMPADFPEGLTLAAICKRENPFDVLVSADYDSLDALPYAATVGTGSLRRQSQLLAFRPDLKIKPLRGNINTRLAKLEQGEYQAIVLAAAGLQRLQLDSHIKQFLPENVMLPACGQGALAIECRKNDPFIANLIHKINDPVSELCVHTERMLNHRLGGNCHTPIAIFCSVTKEKELTLQCKVLNDNGTRVISEKQCASIDKSLNLVDTMVNALKAKGVDSLLGLKLDGN